MHCMGVLNMSPVLLNMSPVLLMSSTHEEYAHHDAHPAEGVHHDVHAE